ncbi:MAG: phosphate signaling complex protein PhoU [SAR202 cluster bacterium]|nr:phosphate signaling complex protein PhoU [SAR202 cluster bacterium]
MLRSEFHADLQKLQDDLMNLGSMVEKATIKAIDALKTRDLVLSQKIIEEDDVIDDIRYEIEARCEDLIAKQQPLATDLRLIIAIMHIVGELERIGDYAEGVAKISLAMGDEAPLKPLIDIPRMAQKASLMTRQSLDALVQRDVDLAITVAESDDEVDALYDQIFRELVTFMIEDPRTIQRATYLLWVAHDLERIADRATNIAERVVYLVTGELSKLKEIFP